MIEYLTLASAEPQAYRHREGGAVKLRFEGRKEGPIFSYIHRATEELLLEWQGKVGQTFAVTVRKVIVPGALDYRTYDEARLFNGLRKALTRDPRNDP